MLLFTMLHSGEQQRKRSARLFWKVHSFGLTTFDSMMLGSTSHDTCQSWPRRIQTKTNPQPTPDPSDMPTPLLQLLPHPPLQLMYIPQVLLCKEAVQRNQNCITKVSAPAMEGVAVPNRGSENPSGFRAHLRKRPSCQDSFQSGSHHLVFSFCFRFFFIVKDLFIYLTNSCREREYSVIGAEPC